jgi:hypothetical protein
MKAQFIPLAVAVIFTATTSSHAALTFTSTADTIMNPNGVYVQYQNGMVSTIADLPRTVSTTLVMDLDNMTARFSGWGTAATTTLSYTTGTYSQQVGSVTHQGYSSVTITLNVDAYSFDTGVRDMYPIQMENSYGYYYPDSFSVQGSMSVEYSVTSDGQTVSASDSYQFTSSLRTSGILNLDFDPPYHPWGLYVMFPPPPTEFSITAPNGFNASFTVVPEPSHALLCGAGSLLLFMRRRRHRA